MKIENIIKAKYENDNLAHLYILEPNISINPAESLEWTISCLEQVLGLTKSRIENSEDILILNPSEAKSYTVDHCSEIFKFTSFAPQTLKRKFLILNETHKLSTTVSNKLLKTFEEPPVPLTIFLMNENKSKILETIRSRAIKLRITLPKDTRANPLIEFINKDSQTSFEDFDKFYQDNYSNLSDCIKDLIHLATSSQTKEFSDSIHHFKTLQDDITYNNAQNHIKLKVYGLLTNMKLN